MFIEIWDIFLPVQLFPPVCLLVLGKCSSLYVYSILYDYLVLKSKHLNLRKVQVLKNQANDNPGPYENIEMLYS